MEEYFNEYESKPITRLAYQVSSLDQIQPSEKEATSILVLDGNSVEFKHYEPVNLGDFIVYLNDEDIYHCTEEVFKDRNIT